MANVKITDLGAYTNPVSTDVLPIVDVSADSTKKVSIADLLENAGSGTAAAPGIAFDGDGDTGIYRPGANQVAISTNGAERARIDSSGYLRLSSNSGGIQFNGDTAAANALDDYEEGTCFASTGNWTNASETRYTKIGRYICITFRGGVVTSSQTLTLPFTSSATDILAGFTDKNGTTTKLFINSSSITLGVGFHKGFIQYHTT